MAQRKPSFPEFGFVRLPQILACIPICESAWWEGCRTGRYPKPVKLGPAPPPGVLRTSGSLLNA